MKRITASLGAGQKERTPASTASALVADHDGGDQMPNYTVRPQPRHLRWRVIPLRRGEAGGRALAQKRYDERVYEGLEPDPLAVEQPEPVMKPVQQHPQVARMREAFYAALDAGQTVEQARDAALGGVAVITYEKWPCPQHPGVQAYMKDECPGDGYSHRHCIACHGLYVGYVQLCPMHEAAAELLAALLQYTANDDALEAGLPFDTYTREYNRIYALAKAAIAKARGEAR